MSCFFSSSSCPISVRSSPGLRSVLRTWSTCLWVALNSACVVDGRLVKNYTAKKTPVSHTPPTRYNREKRERASRVDQENEGAWGGCDTLCASPPEPYCSCERGLL